jgi:predicted nucleic acid-binding protein
VILVDTSVWVGHLRSKDRGLADLLDEGRILSHPFVVGELALGNLRHRDRVLSSLQRLPQVNLATNREVLEFVEQHHLYGIGIGYIDAHLLASVRLTLGTTLWTRDKRLQAAAEELALAWTAGNARLN